MIVRYTMVIVIFLLFIMPAAGVAQNHEVRGVVTDASTGETMPGVNVVIQGTSQGTTTDLNGDYSINVPASDAVLVFSYIGYESVEIAIEGRSIVNVELALSTFEADELVVVGYGTQHRWQVTGSMSSIDMGEVSRDLPNTNLTQALSGVAGVVFTGDGRPGQSGNLMIRGQNSLSAGTSPLVVLDGIIFQGNLADINPQDIASIDILKDASSAAIYGSRAANGVILVTSKEGITQAPSVNVNMFTGFSERTDMLNLITPERYLQRRLDWRAQSGLEADPSNIASYLAPDEAANYNAGNTTNPWDIASRTGSVRSLDVSLAGRTDNVSYYFSSSHSVDRGLLINDMQERFNMRGNFDVTVTDWLKLGTRTLYTNRDRSGNVPSLQDIYRNSPYGNFYYTDGQPTRYPVESEQASTNSIYSSHLTTNEEIYNNLFSNIYAILETPILNGQLTYRVNYSPNIRWDHNYNYVRQDPYRDDNNTSASKFNRNSFNWELENILSYQGSINENNSFDITLLYGRRHSELESTNTNTGQLSLDGLGFHNLGLGSNPTISSNSQEVEGISFMGRINYQFKSRYLFTFTARRDGSSVFAVQNKYATLPSGAFSWIISDEHFMRNSVYVTFLKFRISHGEVGNEAIQPYQSLGLATLQRYTFGSESALGVITSTLGNDGLKWETTTTTNAGIDFELFGGRLGGTVDIYNSATKDLLVRRSIPIMSGYNNILTNIGEVNNKGIEITINTHNIQKSDFSWGNTITASYNRNQIVHLFGTDLDGDGREDDSIANSWFIGYPVHSFYDYVFDGIYQVGDTDIPPGLQPGDVRVKDINGDGVITPDDRQVVGSGGTPEFQFGLTNRFNYRNFELSIFINAMLGWDAPFNLINPLVPGRAFGGGDYGWWTHENQSNTRPSLIYTNPYDTNWYFSRNFIRIRDVSLSYEFDQNILNRIGLSNLRMFISAKNLHTFTNWPGADPESAGNITSSQGPGSDGAFPMSRTVSFGINVGI